MEKINAIRVLFVEDEPLALELMGKTLTEHGYVLQAFSCPVKALDWLIDNTSLIDVLVTDQSMPNLTGSELVVKSRLLRPRLPVIIVTGIGKVSQELEKSGPTFLLEKPYRKQQLFNAIENIVGECR